MSEQIIKYRGRLWPVEAESPDHAKLSLLLDLSRFLDGEELVSECVKLFCKPKKRRRKPNKQAAITVEYKEWLEQDGPRGKGRLSAIPLKADDSWRKYTNYSDQRREQYQSTRKHLNNVHRAQRLMRMPQWADRKAIKAVYDDCPEGYHVDHVIPLQGE